MIRNAVIHISNEQPLVADLFALPTPGDVGLLCTNVRTPDGKRPVFVDRSEATFFFPYLHIRFIEMPSIADDGAGGLPGTTARPASAAAFPAATPPDDDPSSRLPVPIALGDGIAEGAADGGEDLEIEIDEDFLRKIRDL